MYYDPKSIEYVHRAEGKGMAARHNRDYYTEESPDRKDARQRRLNDFKNSEVHPYANQGDIRVLQKALAEQGYDMSSSTKADGTMDGIWGKDTKAAFAKYQADIKLKEQQQKVITKKQPTKKKQKQIRKAGVNLLPTNINAKIIN